MTTPGTVIEKPECLHAEVPAGLGKTVRTVIFGLLGVAANRHELTDSKVKISPVRIIVVAVIFMVLFVGSLITLASKIASG